MLNQTKNFVWTPEKIDIGREFFLAIKRNQLDLVSGLIKKYPWLVQDYIWLGNETWLSDPVRAGRLEMIKLLLDHGFNINALDMPEETSALSHAMNDNQPEPRMVEYLLKRGADPNLDRPLISAMNNKDPKKRMEYIKLLVQYGVDINKLYSLYDDWENAFTALDWANGKPEVEEYLLSLGAMTSEEVKSKQGTLPRQSKRVLSSQDQNRIDSEKAVVDYFEKLHGKIEFKSIIDIIPSQHPITVHIIKPHAGLKHLVLFTTGISYQAMNIPEGEETFQFAELFMELPASWNYENINNLNDAWPAAWLQKIGQYPHLNKTWLGGAVTIIDNEEPPKRIAPDVKFTSFMLFAEKSFTRSYDQASVILYRVVPLYPEEREYERKYGTKALVQAFDKNDVPFILDINRKRICS